MFITIQKHGVWIWTFTPFKEPVYNSYPRLTYISSEAELRNGGLDTAAALLVDDPKALPKHWTPAGSDQGLNKGVW